MLTFDIFSPALVSMLVEVDTVSLSNDISVLGCSIHRGSKEISHNLVVNRVEM
jgi:hypothetical protein